MILQESTREKHRSHLHGLFPQPQTRAISVTRYKSRFILVSLLTCTFTHTQEHEQEVLFQVYGISSGNTRTKHLRVNPSASILINKSQCFLYSRNDIAYLLSLSNTKLQKIWELIVSINIARSSKTDSAIITALGFHMTMTHTAIYLI